VRVEAVIILGMALQMDFGQRKKGAGAKRRVAPMQKKAREIKIVSTTENEALGGGKLGGRNGSNREMMIASWCRKKRCCGISETGNVKGNNEKTGERKARVTERGNFRKQNERKGFNKMEPP